MPLLWLSGGWDIALGTGSLDNAAIPPHVSSRVADGIDDFGADRVKG
jgi:hypothetical protein